MHYKKHVKLPILSRLLFIPLFLIASSAHSATIIFDMNDVLVRQTALGALWGIGPFNFFGLFNPLRIEDTYFEILNKIEKRNPETPRSIHKGRLLPQIICDWLCGIEPNEVLQEKVHTLLKEYKTSMESSRKRKLMQSIADFMFTPDRLAQAIAPLPEGVSLLKLCHEQKDDRGFPAHRIFILSNWDPESFALLKKHKQIKKILQMCDGIVISGEAHLMKPDPAIFDYLFTKYGIDPEHELTIYIDDELCNIEAAQQLGKKQLVCIRCKNFKSVKKKLKKLRIIP